VTGPYPTRTLCTHDMFSDEAPLTQVIVNSSWTILENFVIDLDDVRTRPKQCQVVNYENQKIFKKIKFSFSEDEDRHEVTEDDGDPDRSEN
jgi:hypothetical protein